MDSSNTKGESRPLDLNREETFKVLLELHGATTAQLNEIKRGEMEWLKVFLLAYSALLGWSITRWFGVGLYDTARTIKWTEGQEVWVCWTVSIGSIVLAIFFELLFFRERKSYYRVRRRLESVQEQLGLFSISGLTKVPIIKEEWRIGYIRDAADWRKKTKPFSSFLTRSVYLWMASSAVLLVCWGGFHVIASRFDSVGWLLLLILLNTLVFVGFYVADAYCFKGEND